MNNNDDDGVGNRKERQAQEFRHNFVRQCSATQGNLWT